MYAKFIVFFFFLTITGSAQTVRINSLKKRLPALQDRARVNCLNALGWEFTFNAIHSDSALNYANLAYQYASTIRYTSGKAVSLLIQGDVQGRLLGNLTLMEHHSEEAIALLKGENDPKNLSKAYYKLAIALSSQGEYARAHDAALKARQISIKANDKSGVAWATQAIGHAYCFSGAYWQGFENLI